MPRDYKKERENYDGTPKVMAKNASRKRARRLAIREGIIKEGDPRQIGHQNGDALDNRLSNLKPQSARSNQSYPRTKTAKKVNPRD